MKVENAEITHAYLLHYEDSKDGSTLRLRYKDLSSLSTRESWPSEMGKILVETLMGPPVVTTVIGKVLLEVLNASPEDRKYMEEIFARHGLYVEEDNTGS